jgi:hypothetical protein
VFNETSRLEELKVHALTPALDGHGQLHASAALTPEIKTPVPIDWVGPRKGINAIKNKNI